MYNRDTDTRHIQAISSGPRRYGRQVKRSKTSSAIKTDDAKNEINTRADTICVGANWILLSASGQYCDIYGSHDKFKGIEDVPIARVATVICYEHIHLHILIFNQAIYLGAILDHSLINTNQISHFGIPVSDNPYDSERDFGINHDDQFIPFKSEVSTVFFN